MHRAIRSTALARKATRNLSSSPCWCQSNIADDAPSTFTTSRATSSSSAPSPLPAYSLPIDAYTSAPSTSGAVFDHHPASSATRAPAPRSRQRQRQNLTDSEAKAFADLLGEIMPRSMGVAVGKERAGGGYQTGSIFDLKGPRHKASSEAAEAALGQVKDALMRKMGGKLGSQGAAVGAKWERRARDELTEQEELELDRLKEELMGLKTDREVLLWGMKNVFGFGENGGDVFPDPAHLAVSPPLDPAASVSTIGPSSPLYPHLLQHLFLLLRDTFSSPLSALALFSLASSNPYSYISGCTPSLYSEVLRTRWEYGGGDVQGVAEVLDEMRANGVTVDGKGRDLVRAIGEAVRIDEERAELRVEHLIAQGQVGAEAGVLSGMEKEKEVERRRFFGEKARESWARMEQVVEEVNEEIERGRREKEEERRAREEEQGDFSVASSSARSMVEDYSAGLNLPGFKKDDDRPRRRFGRYGDDTHSDAEVDFRTSPPPTFARPSRRTSSPYDEPVREDGFGSASRRGGGRGFREERVGGRRERRSEERGERQQALWWKQ
ncbi:hypothetical protein JCM11251_002105 [Rhodosporidiobolus azoricus]